MRIRRTLVAAVTGACIVAGAASAGAVTIDGSGTRWRPRSVDIDRGEKVRWRAVSGTHTVRAYGGGWRFSERLGPGDRVSRRFGRRGTFTFYCSIHGSLDGARCTGMCGRVRV